jgi:hypothetical protein
MGRWPGDEQGGRIQYPHMEQGLWKANKINNCLANSKTN